MRNVTFENTIDLRGVAKAARMIGVSPTYLRRRLRKANQDEPEKLTRRQWITAAR